MKKTDNYNQVLELIQIKASLKQKIYRNTKAAFQEFKQASEKLIDQLVEDVDNGPTDVIINYTEKGEFEFHIKIGGDIVMFQMHTNVFDFDPLHSVFKTSYLKEDRTRSYCGIINIYNFLADSVKYNRYADSGYLIGRIFINSENHFFVEGRQKLNFIFNDFINEKIHKDAIAEIITQSIIYSMEFDLFTPPYQEVQETQVGQLVHASNSMQIKTAKRLGFKFSFED